ncbi:MAG: carbohydrate ABC transporter permease [Clostridiales bacterium]|jgi:putative aldouronate transport system permease protein|nr:carbohydrate ABC transporter permease [Clostridiales bacterium]
MKKPASNGQTLFNLISYTFLTLLSIVCLAPFIMLISGSFTDEEAIAYYGYSLWPQKFSIAAYRMLFRFPRDIIRSYGVSVFVTVSGTLLGLFIISMTAYVIGRKDVKYRNKISFYFYFVTLFNGGLVATYIAMVRYYNLKNSYIALILPLLMNAFYLIVMRSFLSSLPVSLAESAKMDGAGNFAIYSKIILPLSKPALATVGLFIALDYWNDWYNAMLFISTPEKYPLQYVLYSMLSTAEALSRISAQSRIPIQGQPRESIKLAMACIATGPIILLYPFVQKFFIRGITIGAVKG